MKIKTYIIAILLIIGLAQFFIFSTLLTDIDLMSLSLRAPIASAATLNDGDIIQGPDGIKIYIINGHGYKRHIFNPQVFNMYGHLRWDHVKSVDEKTLNSYKISDFYRTNSSPNIYQTTEDGVKRWLDMTGEQFIASGYDFNQVFTINEKESNYYKNGSRIEYYHSVIGDIPATDNKEINIQSRIIVESYGDKLVEIWGKSSFSEDELGVLIKDKDGRPMSVEEIGKKMEIVGTTEAYVAALGGWQNFETRVVEEFKKASISSDNSSLHKSIISWYKYHISYIDKLKKSTSTSEIKNLNKEYFTNVDLNAPNIKARMAELFGRKIENDYAIKRLLIKIANAAPILTYSFGGRIISYVDTCSSGIAFFVAGLKGGLMWLYYSTWALNPYLYRIVVPNYQILGESILIPGVCTKVPPVAYPQGMATILYFGTSLTP